MFLSLTYSSKTDNTNRIFLVKTKSNLKELSLSADERNYFSKRFSDNNILSCNNCGNHTIVCKIPEPKSPETREEVRLAGNKIYKQLKTELQSCSVTSTVNGAAELFLEGMLLSSYTFDKYLSEKNPGKLKKVVVTDQSVDLKSLKSVSEAVFWARDLVNEPVSYLTANQLANEIKSTGEKLGVKVEVFGKQKLQTLKMGGLLAVNKGSLDPPTFSILEWKPKKCKNKKPIVLVGKGIVYDTGGLSLKPTANAMDLMKADMGGAATVAATMMAVAKLKLPLHVITLIPATDNRPGGNAYAPGDIITMFDKTTVEVKNTDAEGRMALADALAYAKKYDPELAIDAATLTGAAARAIGVYASVIMGNAKQKEIDELIDAGDFTYDRVVQFPFWDEYGEEMKSPIADLKNLGSDKAGMITAGKFLEHFTDYPYIHIDIAGSAFLTEETKYHGKGGTGVGVRLLVEFLKRRSIK